MKPENKSKRQTNQGHRTYKTKDDFLRWLRKQDAIKKQVREKHPIKPNRPSHKH
jgi:hypothetical protein